MKATPKIIGRLIVGCVFACCLLAITSPAQKAVQDSFSDIQMALPASEPADSVLQKVSNISDFQSLNAAELEVLVKALDATPAIPVDKLPRKGMGGTYFSLQHPEWPPLPGDTSFSPAWDMGEFFLLQDTAFDYDRADKAPAAKTKKSALMSPDGSLAPGAGGDGGTNYFETTEFAQFFTTNDLWLEITRTTNTTTTNGIAFLTIHPPWNITNGIYDLFDTTNLAIPHGWSWVLRCAAGQTNLIGTNLFSPVEFFILPVC